MFKIFFSLFILLSLTGCDSVVSKTKQSEPVVVTKQVSCSHYGYCYGCGIGFDGKQSCGYKNRSSCSGEQLAEVEETLYLYKTESGKTFYHTESNVLKRLSSCS